MGLSACTGTLGTCRVSISSFSRNRNFCVRSTANDGTTTVPPRCKVVRMSAAICGRGSLCGCTRLP